MSRFRWKLQRVLDITGQRERVLKGELFALVQAILGVREEIMQRQAMLRTLLAELARRPLGERLPEQRIFLDFSVVEERQIDRLRGRLKQLEAERAEKQDEFLRTRATRQTLERKREQARQEFLKDVLKREQAAFDEGAHIAFARARPARAAAVSR